LDASGLLVWRGLIRVNRIVSPLELGCVPPEIRLLDFLEKLALGQDVFRCPCSPRCVLHVEEFHPVTTTVGVGEFIVC